MDEDASWRVIAAERRALADLLDGLTPQEWEGPTLCDGWRVRDVAAHVALTPQHPSTGAMLVGAVRARGDFDRLNHDLSVAHAARPPARLVEELRMHAESRRLPFVTSYRNLLMDVITHVQDVAVPLGLHHDPPADGAQAAAQRVWDMGWPFHARRRLRGLRLVATDGPFAAGEGEEVRGSTVALLLLMSGRTAAAARDLTGPGTARLATRP
ncbi:maleylpyruvate isomerase family mycothiol-dependent enzyme [Pseudonocardia broussonetiae]|uniref:Maleylpyruvate isomerase family mycothiol-dependent enzyme n=1 Tax=Pseudonocardia broussonetiae TaxID=2736640 RepID=A0A6M6JKD4_9PSEU|nr:maleylpyruvate isomerase family mycothiol-dependent enzyme [Pseudonocardia broussonetiae]QJY46791.1 maleylpyruvate isomerase family mycothiol-dependent enzyme [Pseudonocardia broussonetiae]